MSLIADVLLVTVNKAESQAVVSAFREAAGHECSIISLGGRAYQDLGLVNGQHVVLVQSEMGTMGLGASLQTVQEALDGVCPSSVIMLGVAFGMNQLTQDVGEILVSKQIVLYEPQRVSVADGAEKFVPRGSRVDASTRLLSHFRAAELHWDNCIAKVEFGLMVSGEKLVDSVVFRQQLLEMEPEAIGGEMEGAGLYAACQRSRVDWILVKAVCDYADGNKSTNKTERQLIAANNAARFVLHTLLKAPLERSGQLVAKRTAGTTDIPAQVTITLEREFETFGQEERTALLTIVSRLVGIERAAVRIIEIVSGSLKAKLEMSKSAAERLADLWRSKNRELLDLGVTDLTVERKREGATMPGRNPQLSERRMEDVVVASLADSPLFSALSAEHFDPATMLDSHQLADFIAATQPKEWAKLTRQFPGTEREALASYVTSLIQKRGTLEVLRNGVSFSGINVQLAFFKPSAGGNPEHQSRYEGNRFVVVRQVHFSTKTPDQSLDVLIMLNGLPLVSVELKNHFTGQNVQHALAQYRRRDAREPFWSRCLVHFAVDDDAAYFATHLQGADTEFKPFNRDTHNPIIPGGFASSYLWEDFTDEDGELQAGILRADSLLMLIQNYLHYERDSKIGKERFIFPRFHQLLAVRKLLAHAKSHGAGHNYLVQHSAGSGKSNSIAWLAHQLANLCSADGRLVFDSIVVITDRKVLDSQLQNTIKQFEKIKGTVSKIDRNTRQLVKALERGDKIVISTLQKFGFVGELAKLPAKNFAVIVDEAHSSQTGENVRDLKLVLTSEEQLKAAIQKDNEGEAEDPIEAELEMIQKARQKLPHLSFFAFTATPKHKTLELFGTPDKRVKKGFRPFHQYSMRQAIAEGFILDVLESYATYKTYFELIENEKAVRDKEVEKLKARRLMLEYVDRHAFAIRRKAHIIVDHFARKTAHKIGGQAKAMVVTHSRAHAVLYKQALDEVLREQNLPFGVLVAFSSTVTINQQRYTEESMNPPGTGDIGEAFKNPAQRILVAANKFQTGFDQPLLHTMYVDKRLGGVAAVQTLSRLNRTFPPLKQDTMVLDFVNDQEVIQASFQDYYQETELEGATDPNKLYNLKYTLEQMHVFTPDTLAEFVELFVVRKLASDKLQPFFRRIVETGYLPLSPEEKDRFRKETARYTRQYSFISQIMTFTDTALEKFYLFTKLLLRQLPYETQTLPLEVIEMIDMDKFRLQEEQNGRIVLAAEDGILETAGDDGHRNKRVEEKEKLKIIVQRLNEDYGLDFNEADRVVNAIKEKLEGDEGLKAAFSTNSVEFLRRQKLEDSIKDAFLSNADEFLNFMSKTETDPAFGKFFFSEMFKWYSQAVGPGTVA